MNKIGSNHQDLTMGL